MKKVFVINSAGEEELFSFQKVYDSARRAGASKKTAQNIARTVEKESFSGMLTSEIFERVKKLLHRETPRSAIKFNLKRAMKKLGPTGFPFEKYAADLFRHQGYKTETNLEIKGGCLSYEIDFTAQKDNVFYFGECKYRNLPGNVVHSYDIQANYAKFLDLQKGKKVIDLKEKGIEVKFILATNTKFTSRTIDFGRCFGVELLGWRWPRNRGLERLIEEKKFYPVTILPSLTKKLADIFALSQKMMAEDILRLNPEQFARTHNVSPNQILKLQREAKILLG